MARLTGNGCYKGTMSVNQATQLLKTRTASQLCKEYGFNYFTFMKWFRRMAGSGAIKDINKRKLKKAHTAKKKARLGPICSRCQCPPLFGGIIDDSGLCSLCRVEIETGKVYTLIVDRQ